MNKRPATILVTLAALAACLAAENPPIPFDDAHWNLANARVEEHLGRSALSGTAVLKEGEFENGVIEYDLAVSGARSYPGVVFRSRPDGSWERFYIRPHRSGRVPPALYPDVLQYLPAWNRVDSWQLYSGPGYTAGAVIPVERWFHVRIEVTGERARVFVDNHDRPDLEVPHLRHGLRRGGVALMGPADGSAWFSRFTVRRDDGLDFGPARRRSVAPGFVRAWQISPPLRTLELEDDGPGLPAIASRLTWQELAADEYGLVDAARRCARSGQPDTVFLKTVIQSARAETRPYRFGYSDTAVVYLNGRKLYAGDNSYQGRDPSFLGIVGLNDTLHLPLQAGANELLVALGETSGGWGFQLQDAAAEERAPGVDARWQTARRFAVPESVAYDSARRVYYVSNFDPFNPSGAEGRQAICRIGPDGGELPPLLQGVCNPTGLTVYRNFLYAVERRAVAEIDIATGRVARRFPLPEARLPNDVAVDGRGVLYVSDSLANVIWRIAAGKPEVWLRGPEVQRPNGVCVSGDQLIWGNNGDGYLKAADRKSRQVTIVADLSGGTIDGVSNGPGGNWLVSHNEGRLFQVSPAGVVTPLLDQSVSGTAIADFAYDPGRHLVVFPTFADNRVMAVTLPPLQPGK